MSGINVATRQKQLRHSEGGLLTLDGEVMGGVGKRYGLGGCHVSHVEGGATLRLKEGLPRKDQCISLKVPKIGNDRVGQDRKTDPQ